MRYSWWSLRLSVDAIVCAYSSNHRIAGGKASRKSWAWTDGLGFYKWIDADTRGRKIIVQDGFLAILEKKFLTWSRTQHRQVLFDTVCATPNVALIYKCFCDMKKWVHWRTSNTSTDSRVLWGLAYSTSLLSEKWCHENLLTLQLSEACTTRGHSVLVPPSCCSMWKVTVS